MTTAPDGTYIELLAALHAHLRPRGYLEIGVNTGASLALARPGTRAVGIDPVDSRQERVVPGTRTYSMTSDAFFAEVGVASALDGAPLDLAFVDGMHLAEFALRDVANVEAAAHPGTVLLLHDTNPPVEVFTGREFRHGGWTGDVWKTVVTLRRQRAHLRISTLDVIPTGLTVVTGFDPGRDEPPLALDQAELDALTWSDLDGDRAGLLGLVPGTWDQLLALVPAPLQGGAGIRDATWRAWRRVPTRREVVARVRARTGRPAAAS